MKQTNKAFTLVELLVVITIIGLISTIVIINFTGVRQSALSAKGKANQHTANIYCTMYPGVSYPNGDQTQPVYCDNNSVMWSPTLTGTYQWKEENTALPTYAKGNCNNLTDKDIVDYPACQACRNLDYAGFSEGWRLPTQSNGNLDGSYNCNAACSGNTGDGGAYCAPGRQLWDFGAEQCPHWGTKPCSESQGACTFASGHITWDAKAVAGTYWSATQYSSASAWVVSFSTAYTYNYYKTTSNYVRCVLGSYNK